MLGCCWWSVWPGPPPALEMLTKARRWKVPGATPVNVCSSRSIMLRTQGQTKIIINLCFWAVSYAAERPHRNSFGLIIGYQNHKRSAAQMFSGPMNSLAAWHLSPVPAVQIKRTLKHNRTIIPRPIKRISQWGCSWVHMSAKHLRLWLLAPRVRSLRKWSLAGAGT